jgi:hypothetical protein
MQQRQQNIFWTLLLKCINRTLRGWTLEGSNMSG